MSIALTLKESTAEAHRLAENRPMQKLLVRGELDGPRLALYLRQLHHLHETLERLFDARSEQADAMAWNADYRHSERLRADLEALGASVQELPVLDATTAAARDVEARTAANRRALIGSFYVLEGSMNGNRFIVKGLKAKHPLADRCAFTYFDPYGDEQPGRWVRFKTKLDELDLSEADREAVVASALAMFEGIGDIADDVMDHEACPEDSSSDGVAQVEVMEGEAGTPRCPVMRFRKRLARADR